MKSDLLSGVWAHPNERPSLTYPEWEDLLGQARKAGLIGRLAQHCADQHWLELIPEQPRHYLQGALRLVDRQHQEVRWEVDCILRALQQVPTPVVMLKGAAYFVGGLPSANGRLFSDIDILVDRLHLPEVERALFRAGWISQERDAYNDRYYREWMHEIPPLKHVKRGTVIDVHHTITPPTSRFKVDGAKLLDQKVEVAGMRNLFVLAPADMVLHSAVHLFQEGDFSHGLRDLLDLNDLLLHFSTAPEFWLQLLERAKELGLQLPLFYALHHTQRLLNLEIPDWLQHEMRSIRPNWVLRGLMSALLNRALQPRHPSCDGRLHQPARWLLYVRSHFLRMPWYLIIPHLARKSYMRNFPEKSTAQAGLNH